MNQAEHKEAADRFLEKAKSTFSYESQVSYLAIAQVHATLATIPDPKPYTIDNSPKTITANLKDFGVGSEVCICSIPAYTHSPDFHNPK